MFPGLFAPKHRFSFPVFVLVTALCLGTALFISPAPGSAAGLISSGGGKGADSSGAGTGGAGGLGGGGGGGSMTNGGAGGQGGGGGGATSVGQGGDGVIGGGGGGGALAGSPGGGVGGTGAGGVAGSGGDAGGNSSDEPLGSANGGAGGQGGGGGGGAGGAGSLSGGNGGDGFAGGGGGAGRVLDGVSGAAVNGAITGGSGGGANIGVGGGGGGAGVLLLSNGGLTINSTGVITGGNGGAAGVGGGGGAGLAAQGAWSVTNQGAISGGVANGNGGGGGSGLFLYGGGSLTNAAGGTITGGKGGNSVGSATTGGDGGDGVRANNADITNAGDIQGGWSGSGNDNPAGDGGNGLYVYNDGIAAHTITNTGRIQAGVGGDGFGTGNGGNGGTGALITGDNWTLINAGGIHGGAGGTASGGGTAGAAGNAVTFVGNNNTLELRSGYSFTNNVVATAATNTTLRLGGTADASFDAGRIKAAAGETDAFAGFSAFEKTGASTWTLTGTDNGALPWTIKAGKLVGNTDSLKGNVDVAANAAVEFNQTADGTYVSVISGAGDLIKSGSSILFLSQANTYTGATIITGGWLVMYPATSLASTSLSLSNGGIFDFSSLVAAPAALKSLTVTGSGYINPGANTADFSNGNMTFIVPQGATAGATIITGGWLVMYPATSLASTSLSLSNGGIFDFSSLVAAPAALKSLTVTGSGYINPGANTADFSNGNMTFIVPQGATAGTTMLTVYGDADITGADVRLQYQTNRPNLALNDSLTLINVQGNTLTADQAGTTVQMPNGDIFTLALDGANNLLAVLSYLSQDTPAYERLKAYAEGRAAALAFVNQGADLIVNQGFGSAIASTRAPGFKAGAFAAGAGGYSRYDTGSHVDVSGFSMLAGVALGNDAGPGRITLGAFFEGGWGSYNSYNSFSNYASVDGDGDLSYYGGGILGRYDVTSGRLAGLYADASFRLGRVSTEFSSSDIRYADGSKADFDSDAMYWGAHAGFGYQWSFTEQAMLDLSARFIWTRQDGDNVNVSGDRVRFDEADSLRTRLGGRFNYAVNEYVVPYIGAYWEHEFDGKQRTSVNGVDIDSPKLRGDTGVGELGLSVRPFAGKDGAASGFSMDLGVQGYTGVREGVTGSLQLKFEF